MPTLPVVTPRSLRIPAMTLERTLVLLPDADVVRKLDQFARAGFLEPGRHPRKLTFGRYDDAERALAVPPMHAGEVRHARPALEKHRVDPVLRHQAARLLDPRSPLVVRDRGGLRLKRDRFERWNVERSGSRRGDCAERGGRARNERPSVHWWIERGVVVSGRRVRPESFELRSAPAARHRADGARRSRCACECRTGRRSCGRRPGSPTDRRSCWL